MLYAEKRVIHQTKSYFQQGELLERCQFGIGHASVVGDDAIEIIVVVAESYSKESSPENQLQGEHVTRNANAPILRTAASTFGSRMRIVNIIRGTEYNFHVISYLINKTELIYTNQN